MFRRFVYRFLKIKLRLAIHLYFKKVSVTGLGNVPKEGPVIFAVNHQNSLLDALVVTVTTSRNPYYLARGDVFRKKWVSFLLDFINIIPIYRARDGVQNIKKNEATIDQCVDLLRLGHPVLIFPEPSHAYKYNLRPIQKGVSRIAFAANEELKNQKISIIPVGIQYENYKNAGYPVLVSYGEPFSVTPFEEIYHKNKNLGYEQLGGMLAKKMKELIVDIQPEEQYEQIYTKWIANRIDSPDPLIQLKEDQKLVAQIAEHPDRYTSTQKEHPGNMRLLYLPFYLVSSIAFFIPWLITGLVLNSMKDDQYIASMKVSIWFLIIPQIIILEALALGLIFHSLIISVAFTVLSLVSGWITIKRYFPL